MNKLIVLEINNFIYTLIDAQGNKYNLNLEFINLDKSISKNDIIYMSDELLVEHGVYTFGPFNNLYGDNIESELSPDIVVLEIDNERTYLQRYYG